MKGGTAINLFLRNLPRLSVDVDLAYLPRSPRQQALPAIRRGLDTIAKDLRDAIPGIGAQITDPSATDALRLALELHDRRIKIEVSPVARGAVWPPETRAVVAEVEESLGYTENRILSFNDLHAGKMCAALERLVADIHGALTDGDRAFLLSVKGRRPDWSLIDLPDVAGLPAVKWKLVNLGRMSGRKHAAALDRLQRVLEAGGR